MGLHRTEGNDTMKIDDYKYTIREARKAGKLWRDSEPGDWLASQHVAETMEYLRRLAGDDTEWRNDIGYAYAEGFASGYVGEKMTLQVR
jgi:hypothetical protein